MGEGQQVGEAKVGGVNGASLWSGTAASWVSLSPAGTSDSVAKGVGGGQQVGSAVVGGRNHASLWSGTAASWVDLNPAGVRESFAGGVGGGQQVGWVGWSEPEGYAHASLWSGTASSWVDLHAFLPANFLSSTALGVWNDGNFTYAVGYGYDNSFFPEALMWVSPVPEPASLFALGAGLSLLRFRRRRAMRVHSVGP